jgi:hypothetical protein
MASARKRSRIVQREETRVTTPERDRDAAIDRLLSAMRGAKSRGPHIEADSLAAWADDVLSRRQRSAVETHAASCERCQAMLAAMATGAPRHEKVARGLDVRAWFRWLVPVTAVVGIAAVVWALQPWRAAPVRVQQEEDRIAEASPPRPTVESPLQERPAPLSTAPSATAPAATSQAAPAPQPNPRPEVSAARSASSTPPAAAPTPSGQESRAAAAPSSPPVAPPRPGSPAAPPRAAAPPAATPSAENLVEARAAKDAPAAAAASAPTRPAPGAPAARTLAFAGVMPVVASPSPASRWRIIPGGDVERSMDGGGTWQKQSTGASQTLTAGSSPAPSVCWLVGPAGLVLLSIDGQTWKRIGLPDPVPLVSVHATNDQSATVTAADGRTFSTTDAGGTWSAETR